MRIADVDLADGATFLSGPPHDYFDFLRREHPVAWVDHAELDGPGFWALTKWDDVMAVERDPETFSSYTGGAFMGPVDEGTRLMMINQVLRPASESLEDILHGKLHLPRDVVARG